MAAFAKSGTFTLVKASGFITVTGSAIEIVSGVTFNVIENGAGYLMRLDDTRPLAIQCLARVTVDRYAMRNSIARNYQRLSRIAETTGTDLVDFGADIPMPDGETSVLSVSLIGTESASIG